MSELHTDKKTNGLQKIGTHGGVFHCDEILACYMLKKLPQFKNGDIVRSRDDSVLNECDIVVDVGGVYDPSTQHYDHHQRSFNETMNTIRPEKPFHIRLSSAGLIYCHFGYEVISSIISTNNKDMLENIYDQVYKNFIQEIDGIDNGIPMYDGEPKYKISTSLSARVKHLNIQWNSMDENETERFYQAYDLVGKEFEEVVNYYSQVWWPAYSIVSEAILNRYKVHTSGEIIELSASGCPWSHHLFELENKLGLEASIKYVIFRGDRDNWRVQCVPLTVENYICRIFLLEEWRGLRDEELSKVSGIDGCIFVHSTGFIGGNKTRNGALEMAIKSLEKGEMNFLKS